MHPYLFRMSFFKIEIRPIDKIRLQILNPGTIFCKAQQSPSKSRSTASALSSRTTHPMHRHMNLRSSFARTRQLSATVITTKMIILDTRQKWQPNTVNTRRDGRYQLWYQGYQRSTRLPATLFIPNGSLKDQRKIVRFRTGAAIPARQEGLQH